MAFNLSPSVNILEKDYSNFVSGISSSVGAIVGEFEWGPVEQVTTVTSEEELVRIFGKPTDANYASWFTAYNFLNYARNLKVVRVLNSTAADAENAVAGDSGAPGSAILIKNQADLDYTALADQTFIAKSPGIKGNNLGVSICQHKDFDSWRYKNYFDQKPYGDDVYVVILYTENNTTEVVETWALSTDVNSKDGYGVANYVQNALERSSEYLYCDGSFLDADRGTASISTGTNLVATAGSKTVTSVGATWSTTQAVTAGEQIVLDGLNAGTYDVESITSDTEIVLAQPLEYSETGISYSFKTVLNNSGQDTYAAFAGGADGTAPADADYQTGWDYFKDSATTDISLLMCGITGTAMAISKYMIETVAETRKDCVAFVSPQFTSVDGTTPVTSMITDRALLPSSSYGFMDGNYKFQYDKYNDKYRWVPLNGDMAGLAAQTDATDEAWFSFAGYNRGNVKNVTKLSFAPNQSQRDDMYLNGINAVITEVGAGTILYGDKTLQTKASAFDRVNVRRLFIVVEKAIANAAKYNLFEFNDEFTRTRFVQTITPFLRDVQSKRGLTDFEVIADETVNTPFVIDNNEFRANILIKPSKSINFINLTFTAVASGVSFDEIIV